MEGLQRMAIDLRIANRVHFLGQRSDVPALMAAADIFCQPNQAPEPFGIVFIEAMRAGLPVLTTRFGGGSEIVSDACGTLIPENDSQGLATCLRQLIQYPDLRRSLSAGGPGRAKELCDPQTQLQKLYDTLQSVALRKHTTAAIV